MHLIFVDECGYQKNWADDKTIREQPFYVVAAVAIPSSHVQAIYTSIRNSIAQLSLPGTQADALGRGEEIKASSVDKGKGFWGENQTARDDVRKIFMDLNAVTYFVVCIDKNALREKYSTPKDPSDLGLQFLLERLQGFLEREGSVGYVLIDANKREEEDQREAIGGLLQRGSEGIAVSRFYGNMYEWKLEMRNIVEIHFGDSKYSLGLQIADFVARHAYSWRKRNKDPNYPGWSCVEPHLYCYPSHVGWGYKEFP